MLGLRRGRCGWSQDHVAGVGKRRAAPVAADGLLVLDVGAVASRRCRVTERDGRAEVMCAAVVVRCRVAEVVGTTATLRPRLPSLVLGGRCCRSGAATAASNSTSRRSTGSPTCCASERRRRRRRPPSRRRCSADARATTSPATVWRCGLDRGRRRRGRRRESWAASAAGVAADWSSRRWPRPGRAPDSSRSSSFPRRHRHGPRLPGKTRDHSSSPVTRPRHLSRLAIWNTSGNAQWQLQFY